METTSTKVKYSLEAIARLVEEINDQIERQPERHSLTPQEHSKWRAFPAQIRAHRYPFIAAHPSQSISALLQSGWIGPSWSAPHGNMPE